MARPKVDSRLQNIEQDVSEIKEMLEVKQLEALPENEQVDCLCNDTKKELENEKEEPRSE